MDPAAEKSRLMHSYNRSYSPRLAAYFAPSLLPSTWIVTALCSTKHFLYISLFLVFLSLFHIIAPCCLFLPSLSNSHSSHSSVIPYYNQFCHLPLHYSEGIKQLKEIFIHLKFSFGPPGWCKSPFLPSAGSSLPMAWVAPLAMSSSLMYTLASITSPRLSSVTWTETNVV